MAIQTIHSKHKKQMFSCKMSQYIYLLFVWYILVIILIGFFNFPKSLSYIGDVINIYIFINAIKKRSFNKISRRSSMLFVIFFFFAGISSAIINLESPVFFLWGVRQTLRFFLFYYSCCVFFTDTDFDNVLKLVTIVFWISLPLCFWEAQILGPTLPKFAEINGERVYTIVGDTVGGIYHDLSTTNNNAPLNIILTIKSTDTLLKYLSKKIKFPSLLVVLAAAVYMAAAAELKVFIVELALIMILSMISNGIKIRNIVLTVVGISGLQIVLMLFVSMNANGRTYYTIDYLKFSGMLENLTRDSGYVGSNDINRFTWFLNVTENIFHNNLSKILFGVGLGNADYSSGISFLQSPYYKEFGSLHYQWFLSSFVYVETGIIGAFLYFYIYIHSMVVNIITKFYKTNYGKFHLIMTAIMMLLFFYNPSMRNEQCAYLLCLSLALPEIHRNGEVKISAESK